MARLRLLLLLAVFGALFVALVPPRQEKSEASAPKVRPSALLARLGDARLRSGGASAPVFRPDSTAIAAVGDDRSDVIEWDVRTANERRRYSDSPPAQFISVIGYTPAGDRMLVRYDLARIVVFDTATSAVVCRVEYDGAIALAPDLRTAAGYSRDKKLTLWSLETGQSLATLGTESIYDVAYSWDGHWVAAGYYSETFPEGRPVVSAAYKGVAWVWPVRGGPRRTLTLPGAEHSNGVSVVWVRPNRVLAWSKTSMAVFDAATGELVVSAVPSGPGGYWIVWEQDGRLYVRESDDSDAFEHDPDTLKRLPGRPPRDVPFGPVYSPDGSIRAEWVGRYIRLVDVRTGRPLHPELDRLPTSPAGAIRFSADSRRMLTTHSESLVWDFPSGAIRFRLGNHETATNAHLTPDGRWVVGLDHTKTGNGCPLVVWEVPSAKPEGFADTGAEVFREALGGPLWSRRGLGLDAGGGFWVHGAGEFVRYEVPSGRILQTVREFERNAFVLLSPDGSRLASGGPSGLAVLRTDSTQWQTLESYSATHRGGCEQGDPPYGSPVAFSPDGRRLLVGCGHAYESGWKLRPWTLSDPPAAGAWCVVGSFPVFTPDGRFVIAGVVESERSNAELALTPATTLRISSPALPKLLRVSDAETGAELFRFDPGAEAFQFAVTPDGTRLVVSHTNTTLSVWDWPALLRENLRR